MTRVGGLFTLHLGLAGTFAVVLLSDAHVVRLGAEDGLIEGVGALAFLLASVFFGRAYFLSESGNDLWALHTRRNVFYAGLAIALFFAGAEEISWGQRIIGFDTPDAMAAINAQGEANLHNLEFLQRGGGLYGVFSLFWFAYCLVLPIVNRTPWVRRVAERIGVPVPPLWIGTLLLSNWLVFKLVASGYPAGDVRHSLNELKETNAALAFLVLAIHEWRKSRLAVTAPPVSTPVAA